ncbi:MAG: hypothetical protein JWP97_4555 [Labilithrix sp.]|nr:hypothetical protein [Labilithrix sp.]
MLHGIRTAQAFLLTTIAVLVAAAIGLFVGGEAFGIAALTLPLPVALLWLSADVRRHDETSPAPRAAGPVVRRVIVPVPV